MNETSATTDDLVLFKNSQRTDVRATLMRITRNIAVFEVYNPYSVVQLSEVLYDVQIRRNGRVIYDGRAVVSNLVSTGLMLVVSATLVDPWSELTDLAPGESLRREVTNFVSDWDNRFTSLQQPYQTAVGSMRNFLEEFSRWLSHGEGLAGFNDPETLPSSDLVREFTHDVEAEISPKLTELMARFEETAVGVSTEKLAVHKEFARRELHPLLLCSPFIHRTFTKPLGYAGDYEMVNMMFRDPWEGESTYAKLVNAAIINSDGARAHRNRIDRLMRYLYQEVSRVQAERRELRVLNIGCGPAVEVQRFIRENELSERCQFDLMDFNEQTLEYARSRIDEAIFDSRRRPNIRMIHKSIHSLLKESSQPRRNSSQTQYDLVYCAGLFDYLSDRICTRLLSLFYDWVTPGGFVVATNVHTRNPVRQFIEHIMEWNLIYRDNEQMLSLAPRGGQNEVNNEETGVNVFLETRKPATPEDTA